MDALDVKISVNTINHYLRPENIVSTKELVRKLNNNLLEPVLVEKVGSIRLSHLKYLVTSVINFCL